jgi:hypothetical protein
MWETRDPHTGSRAYLDFFRFRYGERLYEIFDLLSFHHEVVHQLLLVRCSVRFGEREELLNGSGN